MRERMQLFPINWCWGRKVSENKAIELQADAGRGSSEWFKFCLETRSKQDHAGIYFSFEALTVFYFHMWFYDIRHWNYEKGQYYREGEGFSRPIQP
jgi:hypothetical protein